MIDGRFVSEYLIPYLSDLYKDLALRSFVMATSNPDNSQNEERQLDKVTFIQYSNLPGIISERLLKIFLSDGHDKGFISEDAFIKYMTMIFVSDVDSRMRLTFDM